MGTSAHVVEAFEREFNVVVPPVPLRAFPWAGGGVPCGAANGGGCFSGPLHVVSVRGDPVYGIDPRALMHELLHDLRWREAQDLTHRDPRFARADSWRPAW